jgi:hypothetical protein
MIKNSEETKNRKNVPQHNKGCVQQANTQHYTKWRTTETMPTKFRNETGMSAFSMPIQYSFGIFSQSKK